MKLKKKATGASALDLIEEAVHLLRLAPPGILAGYYFGSVPFVLGLLYFWADMSRNAFAAGYCGPAALGLALLFAWMKYRHAVFAEALFARISRAPAPRRTLREKARTMAVQTCIHAPGLIVLAISFVIAAPLAWAYAFYQNAALPPDDDAYTLKSVCGKAWEQAKSQPGRNHLLLSVLSLFGFFVFLNIGVAVYFLPQLLKSILGIETIFTMSIHTVLNTTFLTAVTCMTWLSMDPLIKAIYVLRCFYGRSLKTGEDIRVELRAVAAAKKTAFGKIAVAILFFLMLIPGAPVDAQTEQGVSYAKPAFQDQSRSAERLDQVIREVVKEREFAWRMPREKEEDPEEETGMIASFFEWLGKELKKIGDVAGKWYKAVHDWLDDLLPKPDPVDPSLEDKWMPSARTLLYALLSVLAVLLAMLLWKVMEKRKQRPDEAAADIAPETPDLEDEEVQADALPTDEWLALAADLAAEGSLRLALRAVYLGTLAFLAENQMIAVARHKSNREYEQELRRRAHDMTEAVTLFSGGVSLFDSVWYGKREVTEDDLKRFSGDYKRIRAVVE